MDTTQKTDYEKITEEIVYGLTDERYESGSEKLIYVGVTHKSLVRRRSQHFEEAKRTRTDRPIARYLQEVMEEGRRNDINIIKLPFCDSEREATEKFSGLLNENDGRVELPYNGPDWSEDEIAMLYRMSIPQAMRYTGYKKHRIVDARKRLGIGDSQKIRWAQWDDLLGTMSDQDLADEIGCNINSVYLRRQKLGVEAHSRKALTDQEARELYIEYHTDDTTYSKLADSYGVSTGTVSRVINGDAYNGLDRDRLEMTASRIEEITDRPVAGLRGFYERA